MAPRTNIYLAVDGDTYLNVDGDTHILVTPGSGFGSGQRVRVVRDGSTGTLVVDDEFPHFMTSRDRQ